MAKDELLYNKESTLNNSTWKMYLIRTFYNVSASCKQFFFSHAMKWTYGTDKNKDHNQAETGI